MTASNWCYIYFHCSYVYNYYNTSNVVHWMQQIFNISYPDDIKLPFSTDLTQRGDKGVKAGPKTGCRQDYFKENSNKLVIA
jgi:hypothetical protein